MLDDPAQMFSGSDVWATTAVHGVMFGGSAFVQTSVDSWTGYQCDQDTNHACPLESQLCCPD